MLVKLVDVEPRSRPLKMRWRSEPIKPLRLLIGAIAQWRKDMRVLNDMNIVAKRDEILATLKENLETHSTIVKEARDGYVEKAEKALLERLAQIKEGKVVELSFTLRPPQDHSAVYRTAIKMMELHQDKTIGLNSSQVQHLIQDEWDWTEQWLYDNSGYSKTAREVSSSKGYDIS
jgi:hypothetical protein